MAKAKLVMPFITEIDGCTYRTLWPLTPQEVAARIKASTKKLSWRTRYGKPSFLGLLFFNLSAVNPVAAYVQEFERSRNLCCTVTAAQLSKPCASIASWNPAVYARLEAALPPDVREG